MSGLRPSNSVTNTVVDTLRFRGITEPGLLITSSSGLVSVGTAPTLTNLVVTGTSMLGTSAVVMGPLTANSIDALTSLTTANGSITNLDASNATIDTLTSTLIEAETVNISNASITNGFVSFLDASNAIVDILDVSAATIQSLDASNATITNASIMNLDVSNATIANLDFSAASISSLDVSNATITNASITNLDVSNATIANLDFTVASINSLDISNATITNGSIGRLAVDISASIANLIVNPSLSVVDGAQSLTVTPTSLYSSESQFAIGARGVPDVLQVVDDGFAGYVRIGYGSGAQVYIAGGGAEGQIQMNSGSGGVLNLGSSAGTNASAIIISDDQVKINAPYTDFPTNPAIIVTDISINIFTPGTSNPGVSVDASGTNVSGRLNAGYAYIGDNTNILDPSANFVYIQAVSGEIVGRIRGSDRSDGTLELSAHNDMSSNIVLNDNGFTSMKATLIGDNTKYLTDPSANFVFINAGAEETVARVRGSNRPEGTLQLGANGSQPSNIVLNADGSTTIQNAVFQNPIRVNNTRYREGPFPISAFAEYIISTPIDRVDGLYSIIIESIGQIINRINISTMATSFTDTEVPGSYSIWVLGGAAIGPPFTYTTASSGDQTGTISAYITEEGWLSIYFNGPVAPSPALNFYANYFNIYRT